MTTFVVERSLSLPSGAKRQFVHAGVQHGSFLLQEEVERVISEFITQEIQHFCGMFHLLLMVIELTQCGISSAFGCQNLALYLLDLDRENLDLELPFLQPSIPSRLCKVERCRRAGDLCRLIRYASDSC